MPGESLCGSLERVTNVIVFRSFGKFFGLAGVRLGFVVTGGSWQGRAAEAQAPAAAALAGAAPTGAAPARAAPTGAAPARAARAGAAAHAIAASFRSALGDWPVSGPAVAIGTAAYRDVRWQTEQRHRLAQAAQRLDALLSDAGLTVAGGTVLYRLARCADADAVFKRLAAHGILTRPFSSDSTLLRVGLPGDESHWQRLATALDARCTS
jgi:cobalamin biosynthetic protein CobC